MKEKQGKLPYELIPFECIDKLAEVLGFGATKYPLYSWKKADKDDFVAAAFRHMSQYRQGVRFDDESGLHHLAHAMCNVVFALWHETQGDNDANNI